VHGAFGLVNSVADHHRRLGDDECAALLCAMTSRSLDAALEVMGQLEA
jgi:hypothetical protein